MRILKDKINQDQNFNNKFTHILIESENHFNNLLKVCSNEFEKNTGSYLIDGKKYEYYIDNYTKQKFLFDHIAKKENKHVLEIGTYMGHSMLIMLLANNSLSATCIDIEDKYSKPAIDYLSKSFPNSKLELIKGDSLKVLKTLKKKYDFFLIDGTHRNTQVTREFNYCINNLLNKNKIDFILDDVIHAEPLKKNIFSSFLIKKSKLISDVPNGNLYFQLELPNSRFKLLYKKLVFFFKNTSWYLKKKISKAIKLQKI